MFNKQDLEFDAPNVNMPLVNSFFNQQPKPYFVWLVILPGEKKASIWTSVHGVNIGGYVFLTSFGFGRGVVVEVCPDEQTCWVEKV